MKYVNKKNQSRATNKPNRNHTTYGLYLNRRPPFVRFWSRFFIFYEFEMNARKRLSGADTAVRHTRCAAYTVATLSTTVAVSGRQSVASHTPWPVPGHQAFATASPRISGRCRGSPAAAAAALPSLAGRYRLMAGRKAHAGGGGKPTITRNTGDDERKKPVPFVRPSPRPDRLLFTTAGHGVLFFHSSRRRVPAYTYLARAPPPNSRLSGPRTSAAGALALERVPERTKCRSRFGCFETDCPLSNTVLEENAVVLLDTHARRRPAGRRVASRRSPRPGPNSPDASSGNGPVHEGYT